MPEKILITGGAGFIGHSTANKLVSHGHFVRVLDNLSKQVHAAPRESLSRLDPAIEFICGDVRDASQMRAALKEIDVVYHLAAETGVGQSMYEIERYFGVNVQGTAVLCDCIAKGNSNIRRIILSSSRAVYGEGQYKCQTCGIVYPKARSLAQLKMGKWDPVCVHCGAEVIPIACQEITPCRPVSIYGLTKKIQEDLLSIISSTYKIPVVILRYFNVFGAGQSISNPYTGILTLFCSRLLRDMDIDVYEDGKMQRDFIHIQEVIRANTRALELDIPGFLVLNVGSGISRTILQLAEFLKAEIGSRSNIALTGRYRLGDIRGCFADMSKANGIIGKAQEDSFEQGIRQLIAWARDEQRIAKLEQPIEELSELGLTGLVQDKKESVF